MPIMAFLQQTRSQSSSPESVVTSMDPGSPEGASCSRSRQRLKPWLEAQINSGRFPGLAWVNKGEGIFRITWKHGGRADWSEQDALIFKEWAIHTGRHREGTDIPDWPSWKTRLRCALNKLPDIQELKDQSCYDEPNPFRVYKFVDRRVPGISSSSPPRHVQSLSEDLPTFPPTLYQPQQRPSVIQPNIPTIVNESLGPDATAHRHEASGDAQVSSLGSDLEQVSIGDLLHIAPENNISLTNISVDSNINSSEPMETNTGDCLKGSLYQPLAHHIKPEPAEKPDPLYYQVHKNDHEFSLTIRYRQQVIKQARVVNPHGCRVFYGDISKYAAMWDVRLFGDSQADQILVPYEVGKLEARQDQLTYTLLDALELGINFYMDKDNIYALRRCKSTVFAAPPNRKDKRAIKVERQHEAVKIFDYNNEFLPAFLDYQQNKGPRPSPLAIVAIGQNICMDSAPYVNLLLSVTISHPYAAYMLSQHMQDNTAVEISRSNDYDHYVQYMKETSGAPFP